MYNSTKKLIEEMNSAAREANARLSLQRDRQLASERRLLAHLEVDADAIADTPLADPAFQLNPFQFVQPSAKQERREARAARILSSPVKNQPQDIPVQLRDIRRLLRREAELTALIDDRRPAFDESRLLDLELRQLRVKEELRLQVSKSAMPSGLVKERRLYHTMRALPRRVE